MAIIGQIAQSLQNRNRILQTYFTCVQTGSTAIHRSNLGAAVSLTSSGKLCPPGLRRVRDTGVLAVPGAVWKIHTAGDRAAKCKENTPPPIWEKSLMVKFPT